MEEITIYKFQLETIIEALRITSNIHESSKGKTCHDRQVRQALEFAKNALITQKTASSILSHAMLHDFQIE